MSSSQETLKFSQHLRDQIDPYLPIHSNITPPLELDESGRSHPRPHVTLTYAQSLDASIALKPGQPTVLSGPSSKAMTHYLRSRHDAIMIGCGTAIADDPTLNCRIEHAALDVQPHPVILDQHGRWIDTSVTKRNVCIAAKNGYGKGPVVIIGHSTCDYWACNEEGQYEFFEDQEREVEDCRGTVILSSGTEDFDTILDDLGEHGVRSVMVEGGGNVINTTLSRFSHLIDTVITTIAPVYLGSGGVKIDPPNLTEQKGEAGKKQPLVRLRDVRWITLDNDGVMCARNER